MVERERERVAKQASFLIKSVWKYFNFPAETDMNMERETINPERSIQQLIWDTILCNSVNQKDMISRE